VLIRLVAIVKDFGKNGISFCWTAEKLYEENYGNILSTIEMISLDSRKTL